MFVVSFRMPDTVHVVLSFLYINKTLGICKTAISWEVKTYTKITCMAFGKGIGGTALIVYCIGLKKKCIFCLILCCGSTE